MQLSEKNGLELYFEGSRITNNILVIGITGKLGGIGCTVYVYSKHTSWIHFQNNMNDVQKEKEEK